LRNLEGAMESLEQVIYHEVISVDHVGLAAAHCIHAYAGPCYRSWAGRVSDPCLSWQQCKS